MKHFINLKKKVLIIFDMDPIFYDMIRLYDVAIIHRFLDFHFLVLN